MFKDQAAVDAYPHVAGARPGDIIFADIDGDGKITANDRIRINKTGDPTVTVGLRLGAQLRSVDVAVFFQGAFDAVQYWRTQSGDIGNYYEEFAANRWTPEHPTDRYPRAFNREEEYWISNDNTYFLRDASYIRLKTVEIGYRVPSRLTSSVRLRDLRLYASGFNVVTWDKFKLLDPEARSQNGAYYTQQRVINVGASVNF